MIVYCELCEQYPIYIGVLRDLNRIIEQARPHPQHKSANLDLITRLLEAKDKDLAVLPRSLFDDDY